MKESNSKGVASHAVPESWGYVGNDEVQALTGVRTGRVLSCEMNAPWHVAREVLGADALAERGRQHLDDRYREVVRDHAQSETPSMYGRTAHGNREIPRSTAWRDAVRIGKSKDEIR